MKRILFTLLVLLPLISCKKDDPAIEPEKDLAFVSIEAFQTKTQIGTNAVPIWSMDDKIAVFGDGSDSPSEFTLRSGAGYTTASFEGVKPAGENFIVYHPSTAKCDGITFRGILETQLSHSAPSQLLGMLPLWGRARELENVRVSSPCGILQLNLKGKGKLKSIVLDAGKPISGEFLCSLADSLFAMIGGANIILMDVPETELFTSETTPFYFVLPPGEYEDLRLTFTPAEGEVLYYTLEDIITVKAGLFSALDINLNDLL
ncbi:MAG: hypothetical protein K6F21_00260 [Bacteroidales bacterium]|nr:hypothetical protein [Bacteroidales bacterium]